MLAELELIQFAGSPDQAAREFSSSASGKFGWLFHDQFAIISRPLAAIPLVLLFFFLFVFFASLRVSSHSPFRVLQDSRFFPSPSERGGSVPSKLPQCVSRPLVGLVVLLVTGTARVFEYEICGLEFAKQPLSNVQPVSVRSTGRFRPHADDRDRYPCVLSAPLKLCKNRPSFA